MGKEKITQFLKKHQGIYLDSMVFIYFFEENREFINEVSAIFQATEKGKNKAFVSKLILAELLVLPYRKNKKEIIIQYLDLLYNFPNLQLVPVNDEILIRTASLRAKTNLSTPDAIHAASALEAESSGFITADQKLKCPQLETFYLKPE